MISTAASKLGHCKRRLDEIYGPYDQFATFITQPGILSRPIYGVLEMPNGQDREDHMSNEPVEDWDRPSTSTRIPTEEMLQSMQELVPQKPLSGLECSDGYSCVAKQQETQLQNATDEGVSMEIESTPREGNDECEHSPDSGFTEGSGCNEEHNPPVKPPSAAWPRLLEAEQIIEHLVHVSPLLSPVRTPSFLKSEEYPEQPSVSAKMDEDDNMDIDETDPEPPAVEPPKLEVNETKAAKAEVSPAPKKSTITISLNALSNEHRKKLFIRWKRPTDIKPTSKALELKPQKTSAPPAKEATKRTVSQRSVVPREDTQPVSKLVVDKPPPGITSFVDYYQSRARIFKHIADQETDKVRKVLVYLESVVFFVMSSSYPDAPHRLVTDTATFLKKISSDFIADKHANRTTEYFKARVRVLSLIVQACLAYQTYTPRSETAKKNYGILTKYECEQAAAQKPPKPGSTGSTNNETPSPASSTHSSNHTVMSGPSPVKDTMMVPSYIYNLQMSQNHILAHLMWAHNMWNDARKLLQSSPDTTEFVGRLNRLCGELWMDASLKDVAEYLLTAVKWLQKEHELMKASGNSRKST